jgi:hypothetical protein
VKLKDNVNVNISALQAYSVIVLFLCSDPQTTFSGLLHLTAPAISTSTRAATAARPALALIVMHPNGGRNGGLWSAAEKSLEGRSPESGDKAKRT